MPIAGHLAQPTRTTVRGCTCGEPPSSLLGLAPGGVYHASAVTFGAVRSYRTLSPLPMADHGRFAFCGTFPRVAPAGRYPAPYPRGARTFLPQHLSVCCARSSNRLAEVDYSIAATAASERRVRSSKPLPRLSGAKCRWNAMMAVSTSTIS